MPNRIDYSAASPEGYKAFAGVYAYLQNCSLSRDLVDLVYLRVSLINGCAYCIDAHTRDLRKLGMPADKLALVPVWREADALFSDTERAALAWAERLTNITQAGAPDADYDAAQSHFSDRELADLTYAICLMNGFNRLAIAFRKTPAGAANQHQ